MTAIVLMFLLAALGYAGVLPLGVWGSLWCVLLGWLVRGEVENIRRIGRETEELRKRLDA